MLEVEHPDTLASVHNLAQVLRDQGKYDVVEELHRRALKGKEKMLGVEHPDTLTSVYCLAYLLGTQERYEDATVLYQRAIAGYRKTLTSHHPRTIACSQHHSLMLEERKKGGPSDGG